LPESVRLKNHHSATTAGERRAQHPERWREQRRAADHERCVARNRRQRADLLVPDAREAPRKQDRGADGDDDERHDRGAARRLDRDALSRARPTSMPRPTATTTLSWQRQPGVDEHRRRHAADHHELALGEVDGRGSRCR
jgi:hypothetical protein